MRLLLSHGADPNVKDEMGQTPVFITKSPEVILELVASGADPNATDCWGLTPMMYATLNDKFVSDAADPHAHAWLLLGLAPRPAACVVVGGVVRFLKVLASELLKQCLSQ